MKQKKFLHPVRRTAWPRAGPLPVEMPYSLNTELSGGS
jgi:hypothetical protein